MNGQCKGNSHIRKISKIIKYGRCYHLSFNLSSNINFIILYIFYTINTYSDKNLFTLEQKNNDFYGILYYKFWIICTYMVKSIKVKKNHDNESERV